jgi:ABC-2 type transport system permease protein
MHAKYIWAVARKDALDLWRNKATLGGLLSPIMMALIYLLITKVFGGMKTDILVYNPGDSAIIQVVTGAFPDASLIQADSAAQVTQAFPEITGKDGLKYTIGVIIPADFDTQLLSGTKPVLQLFFDGKKVLAGTQALLQASLNNTSRSMSSPQPPVTIQMSDVNPSTSKNLGEDIAKIYVPIVLLISLIVGTTFMPTLLIEEKERKTLRMLMTSPASFADIIFGKLVVVLVYQIFLTLIVLAIQNSFTGQVGLVILYAVLGGFFSISLGLLIGSLFNTTGAAAAVEGPVISIFIMAGIFVGPLGQMLSTSPIVKIARLLPTWYIADGVSSASQNTGTLSSHLLDIGVILGFTIILLAVSAWVLRRQSAVAASI